jgi:predicted DNA-binding transcriptional regulator AlpA
MTASDPYSYPPLGMSRDVAARYVGVGTTLFDEMVADGRMPRAKKINGRAVWSQHQLAHAFAALPENGGNAIDAAFQRGLDKRAGRAA